MKASWIKCAFLLLLAVTVCGCAGGGTTPGGSASSIANQQADSAMYKPITYANSSKPGPLIIVLPGEIKSANATFTQKITSNNIADFAEVELGKANFQVLERNELGEMLKEIQLAFGMGDPAALKKFKRGKFKSTQWFVKFDILKAEPVAQVQQGFDGGAVGAIAGVLVGGRTGSAVSTGVGSVQGGEAAGVWIVGLRYKILDANTTEQKASGYFEEKMEMGAKGRSVLGVSQSQQRIQTLDSLAQRLVQTAVADIDAKYK